jgi:hypothetical protein
LVQYNPIRRTQCRKPEEALAYSGCWRDIIKKTKLTEAEGKSIIDESKDNFAEHLTKVGSVPQVGDRSRRLGGDRGTGSGAVYRDVLGREYIDCLEGMAC